MKTTREYIADVVTVIKETGIDACDRTDMVAIIIERALYNDPSLYRQMEEEIEGIMDGFGVDREDGEDE